MDSDILKMFLRATNRTNCEKRNESKMDGVPTAGFKMLILHKWCTVHTGNYEKKNSSFIRPISHLCKTHLGLCPFSAAFFFLYCTQQRGMIGNEGSRCDKVAPDGKRKWGLWLQLSPSNKTKKTERPGHFSCSLSLWNNRFFKKEEP